MKISTAESKPEVKNVIHQVYKRITGDELREYGDFFYDTSKLDQRLGMELLARGNYFVEKILFILKDLPDAEILKCENLISMEFRKFIPMKKLSWDLDSSTDHLLQAIDSPDVPKYLSIVSDKFYNGIVKCFESYAMERNYLKLTTGIKNEEAQISIFIRNFANGLSEENIKKAIEARKKVVAYFDYYGMICLLGGLGTFINKIKLKIQGNPPDEYSPSRIMERGYLTQTSAKSDLRNFRENNDLPKLKKLLEGLVVNLQ